MCAVLLSVLAIVLVSLVRVLLVSVRLRIERKIPIKQKRRKTKSNIPEINKINGFRWKRDLKRIFSFGNVQFNLDFPWNKDGHFGL